MKLKNPFTEETRWLFHEQRYNCGECNENGEETGGMSLHHIRGRISNSPLNAIVLCGKCHIKIGHTKEEESKYLIKTIKYLLRTGYEFTEQDIKFYEDNINLYERK